MREKVFVALVVGLLTVPVLSSPAGATGNPPPTSQQIKAARAKAAELARVISAASEAEQIAAEHFDQANIAYAADKARLVKVRLAIQKEKRSIEREKRLVQSAAVEEYVFGSSASAQLGSEMTTSIPDVGTLTTYAGIGARALHEAVVRLDAAEARLLKDEASARAAIEGANAAATDAATARANAYTAEQAAKHALESVKGHLATLVAEQAAIAAAAAAAKAKAEAAAAAKSEAAQNASSSASVAFAIGHLDPAAAAAAAAATAAAAYASEKGHPALRPAGSTTAGNTAVATAEHYLGVPYVWGGAGPTGFDCSGLTMVAWAAAGVPLDHSAWYQYEATTHIPLSQIEPGDLLFYSFPNDGPDPVTHVAMYVGSGPYGTETIIQAPETGETVSYAPMYYFGFVGVGRP